MLFRTKTKPIDRGQATDDLRAAIDRAIDAAVAGFVDRRMIADALESAAQSMRVTDAIMRPHH
jgi:hypothetical protein